MHQFLSSSHPSSWSQRSQIIVGHYFTKRKQDPENIFLIIFHFLQEEKNLITISLGNKLIITKSKGYLALWNRSPECPKEWLWSDGWDGIPCHLCRRNRRNGNGTGNSSKAPGTLRCCQHLGKRNPRFSKYGRTVSWIRKASPVRPRSGSRDSRIPWTIGKHSIRRRSAGPCPIIRIVSSRLHNWQIWSKNG